MTSTYSGQATLDLRRQDARVPYIAHVYVDLAEFRATVATLRHLVDRGAAHLLVAPGAPAPPVRFDLRGDDPDTASLLENGFPRDVVYDITDVLAAHAFDSDVENFVDVRTHPRPLGYDDGEEDPEVEDEAVAREKFALVAQAFDIESLARRLILKRTAKTPLLFACEWETILRLADDDEEQVTENRLPLAVVKIVGQDSTRPTRDFPNMTLTLDEEDVTVLLATLERLKAALGHARGQVIK